MRQGSLLPGCSQFVFLTTAVLKASDSSEKVLACRVTTGLQPYTQKKLQPYTQKKYSEPTYMLRYIFRRTVAQTGRTLLHKATILDSTMLYASIFCNIPYGSGP